MSNDAQKDLLRIRELLRGSKHELFPCEAALLSDLDLNLAGRLDRTTALRDSLLAIYKARQQIEATRPALWHGYELTLAALEEVQDNEVRIVGITLGENEYTVFQDCAETRIVGVLCTRPLSKDP